MDKIKAFVKRAKSYFREKIIMQTLLLYNTDITDIYTEPIWKIFEKIEKKRLTCIN
jgi:hypothetical protein